MTKRNNSTFSKQEVRDWLQQAWKDGYRCGAFSHNTSDRQSDIELAIKQNFNTLSLKNRRLNYLRKLAPDVMTPLPKKQ